MSAKASGYAKELAVCPNGETISAREKLVLMVLADSHQLKAGHFTYPSVETIAADSMCDRRTCQRYLDALERKGVIRRLRPENQGAGMLTFYFFPALEPVPEGRQVAALFSGRRAAEGRGKGGGRAGEGPPALIERAREREQEQKQKQKQEPPNPQGADALGGAVGGKDEPDRSVENALDRVMGECGFTARRLRKKLRAVMMARMETTGNAADRVAAEVADAWQRYGSQGVRLFRHAPAAEFFECGLWLNAKLWAWNTEEINREALAAERRCDW